MSKGKIFITAGVIAVLLGFAINLLAPSQENQHLEKAQTINQQTFQNQSVPQTTQDTTAQKTTQNIKTPQTAQTKTTPESYNFIRSKFNPNYFTLTDFTTENPNLEAILQAGYSFKEGSGQFFLKYKWIKQYSNNTINLTTPEEIAEFTRISVDGNTPFFYILGIGGTQLNPKLLFAIPLDQNIKSQMPIQNLNIHKKANPEKNFYFDTTTKTLK